LRMLRAHKQLPKVKTPREQESLRRTIAATDAQIDALVYELYGLTGGCDPNRRGRIEMKNHESGKRHRRPQSSVRRCVPGFQEKRERG